MFCKKCGSNLTEGAAFCSVCGERVSAKPHNSESAELHASKDARQHESDTDAAGPKSTPSSSVKKRASRKKLVSIVAATVLAVAAIAAVVVFASMGLSGNQSERDPIVGDWTIAVDQAYVEISFGVRENGSFALTKPLPGGKLLGIPMDEENWNSLARGLQWEKGPLEEEVQQYRLRFDGDVASVLGSAVVSEFMSVGLDINAFLRGSTFEFWVPLGFPESADGEWGFRFAPAYGDASSEGLLRYTEAEMRFDLNSTGEINCWLRLETADGEPPEERQFALGRWSEKANHGDTSDAALSVELTGDDGDGIAEIIFSPNQGD